MGAKLAVLFLGLPIILILAAIGFVGWLLTEWSETESHSAHAARLPLLRRLLQWINKPVPKLFYQRDKKGRYRRIWRG